MVEAKRMATRPEPDEADFMSKFVVGEIAIICDSAYPNQFPVGMEVQIRAVCGPPEDDNEYIIWVSSDGCTWYANNRCLRKKRPPPDWVKLCKLTDLPLVRVKETVS
jgi:hypothetical protein